MLKEQKTSQENFQVFSRELFPLTRITQSGAQDAQLITLQPFHISLNV